jgi:hypothetical protein
MGFHRSHLSHHLGRMRERGLITTEPASNGVDVIATDQGRTLAERARPVHAEAVRRYLTDPLDLDSAGQKQPAARIAVSVFSLIAVLPPKVTLKTTPGRPAGTLGALGGSHDEPSPRGRRGTWLKRMDGASTPGWR